jgi:hypothetical protein
MGYITIFLVQIISKHINVTNVYIYIDMAKHCETLGGVSIASYCWLLNHHLLLVESPCLSVLRFNGRLEDTAVAPKKLARPQLSIDDAKGSLVL